MTYFGFLIIFLLIPIVFLGALYFRDNKKDIGLRNNLRHKSSIKVALILVLVAVIYTTPWDNHLVASGVWWYDHNLVTGITLGWVPIEEYTFFVLQTLMSGLWVIFLSRRIEKTEISDSKPQKIISILMLAVTAMWLCAALVLFFHWNPGRYLALILVWALPPLALQLLFGSDILFKNYRLLLLSIPVPTLYLSIADTLAIQTGTWTINPQLSLNILMGGVLPIEEFSFFLLTNTLVALGMVLAISPESKNRVSKLLINWGFVPVFWKKRLINSSGD